MSQDATSVVRGDIMPVSARLKEGAHVVVVVVAAPGVEEVVEEVVHHLVVEIATIVASQGIYPVTALRSAKRAAHSVGVVGGQEVHASNVAKKAICPGSAPKEVKAEVDVVVVAVMI